MTDIDQDVRVNSLELSWTTQALQESCGREPKTGDAEGGVVAIRHLELSSREMKWSVRHDVDKVGAASARCSLPSFQTIFRRTESLTLFQILC